MVTPQLQTTDPFAFKSLGSGVWFLVQKDLKLLDWQTLPNCLLQLPVEVRLVSKDAPSMAGRVEVRKFGVWGTVCDDDFGDTEAAVVCNALGYKGPAKVS